MAYAPTFLAIRSSIAPEFMNSVIPTTPPHREHCTNIILKFEPVIFASFISNEVLSHLTHFDVAILLTPCMRNSVELSRYQSATP
jgi:hypothetical protein